MLFSSLARFATFQVTMLIMILCTWNQLLYHSFLLFLLLSIFDVLCRVVGIVAVQWNGLV
jgi:hypothetical protein